MTKEERGKMREKKCNYCNNQINKNDPVFYFPKLPEWHKLYDLSECVFHIGCVKKLNENRNIGMELADIAEKIATRSEDAPLLVRDGNIVVVAEINERAIEFNDFENFVEFSIRVADLEYILDVQPPQNIKNRMTCINVRQDGGMELVTPLFNVELVTLSFLRLKQIIKEIKLNVFDDEYVEALNKTLFAKYSKNN